MVVGPGWDPDTIGPGDQPGVARQDPFVHRDRFGRGCEAAHRRRGRLEGELGKGFFYRPTIFADVDPEMRIAQEEIFGPTTALIPVESPSTRRCASRTGSATGSRPRSSPRRQQGFPRHARPSSGITYINAGTTGAEVHLPFGGTKDTGNGHREAGQAALDVFTEWKSIYVDYSGRLQRAQIDNVENPAP